MQSAQSRYALYWKPSLLFWKIWQLSAAICSLYIFLKSAKISSEPVVQQHQQITTDIFHFKIASAFEVILAFFSIFLVSLLPRFSNISAKSKCLSSKHVSSLNLANKSECRRKKATMPTENTQIFCHSPFEISNFCSTNQKQKNSQTKPSLKWPKIAL